MDLFTKHVMILTSKMVNVVASKETIEYEDDDVDSLDKEI